MFASLVACALVKLNYFCFIVVERRRRRSQLGRPRTRPWRSMRASHLDTVPSRVIVREHGIKKRDGYISLLRVDDGRSLCIVLGKEKVYQTVFPMLWRVCRFGHSPCFRNPSPGGRIFVFSRDAAARSHVHVATSRPDGNGIFIL